MLKKITALLAGILIIISIYKVYPKSGSFNDLILNKYSRTKFIHLYIYKELPFKDCRDINRINEFLKYLKTIQLREYRGKIPYEKNDYYYIGIYSNNSDILTIESRCKDFIEVCIVTDKYKYVSRKYKIMNSSLNIKYIEDFFN